MQCIALQIFEDRIITASRNSGRAWGSYQLSLITLKRHSPASSVRRAHAAVRVGRAVGLAAEEGLALELEARLAVRAEVEEGVLHLAGEAVAHAGSAQRLR